jgi:mRNA interferase MazF
LGFSLRSINEQKQILNKMKPGDVWMVDLPHSKSHDQSGSRPAVVIARVAKTIVTIIPLTSNKLALRFPYTYSLSPTLNNGLTNESVALIFHMRAIDVTFLKNKIGKLNKESLTEIRKLAIKMIG